MPRLDSKRRLAGKGMAERHPGQGGGEVARPAGHVEAPRSALGAVCTSGRLPMAMAVTLPRPASDVKPGPAFVPLYAAQAGSAQREPGSAGDPPWYRTPGLKTCSSCTAREGKPVRLRRWSATVNGAPPRRRHEPGYLEVRRVPTVETQGRGSVRPRWSGVFRVKVREARTVHIVRRTLMGVSAVGLATLLASAP